MSEAVADSELVRVFERDPALLAGVDPATARHLRAHGTVPAVRLEPGMWHPPTHGASARRWLGLLVVDGFLLRRVTIDERRVGELVGPGDVVRPWDNTSAGDYVRSDAPWIALSSVTLGVLDHGFGEAAARAPQVTGALLQRLVRRSTHLAAAVAMSEADVDVALERMLVYATDRWGRADGDGVALPRELTDTALAVALGADQRRVREEVDRQARLGRLRRGRAGRLFVLSRPGTSG